MISAASTMDEVNSMKTITIKHQKCYTKLRLEKKVLIRKCIRTNILGIIKLLLVLFLSVKYNLVDGSETDNLDRNKVDNTTKENRSFLSSVYRNGTFTSGNLLWDNILNQCSKKPSVSCLQKNFYSYLDDTLTYDGDIKVTNGVCFKKNNVDVNKYKAQANIIYLTGCTDEDIKSFEARDLDEENSIDDIDFESETPLEEVTDVLYDKGIKFLVTHDIKLTLPEFFFHGANLKVSPRAMTKTGALVHIELEPNVEQQAQARTIFKIKKYIRQKLVMAALAIILVVKLIALKLIFVLPVIFGVTTAKKIFLKLLLFLFPALSHIFKLCSWYHQNYHTTKFHHHHHLITHHHHKQPHGHGAAYGPPSSHGHNSLTVHHPGHQDPSPSYEHYPQDWELSGPGLGNEYIAADIHRNAIANFKPNVNDANDINAWGLGLPPGTSMNVGEIGSPSNVQPNVAYPNGGGRPSYSTGRPVGPQVNPYRIKKIQPKDPEKEALIRAAALAARAPPSPVRDEVLRVSAAKLHETNRIQTESELIRQQKEILAAQDPDTIAAEKFYGPLLDRVDKILNPMGANDIGCRERAVCALYRDPFSHTPYSNLVSNELSKESNELIPPAESRVAIRYYRYVQAARDGQEQNDCVALYPNCNMEFKKK